MLTAKTLQQRLAVETLQRMQVGGWHSIQLRAKARMCANREVICHEEFCLHARDYGLKLAERGVLEGLMSYGQHLDPDRVYSVADTAHAQTVLGWRAEERLENRIEELIDWWRKQHPACDRRVVEFHGHQRSPVGFDGGSNNGRYPAFIHPGAAGAALYDPRADIRRGQVIISRPVEVFQWQE